MQPAQCETHNEHLLDDEMHHADDPTVSNATASPASTAASTSSAYVPVRSKAANRTNKSKTLKRPRQSKKRNSADVNEEEDDEDEHDDEEAETHERAPAAARSKKTKICCTHCNKIARFNYPSETQPVTCATHALPDMINLSLRLCMEVGCPTIASFNFPGETQRAFCATHKLVGMVNISGKFCLHPECKLPAMYNHPGSKQRRLCELHKTAGMVVIVHKICRHENCAKYPSYNYPGSTSRLYCATHQLPGMVNICRRKTCIAANCTKQPRFRLPSEPSPLYCSTHRTPEMVCGSATSATASNSKRRKHNTDSVSSELSMPSSAVPVLDETSAVVTNKTNIGEILAHFEEDYRSTSDSGHDSDETTSNPDLEPLELFCQTEDCHESAKFNIFGAGAPLYCEAHSQYGMINVLKCQHLHCKLECDLRFNKSFCHRHAVKEFRHKLGASKTSAKRSSQNCAITVQ